MELPAVSRAHWTIHRFSSINDDETLAAIPKRQCTAMFMPPKAHQKLPALPADRSVDVELLVEELRLYVCGVEGMVQAENGSIIQYQLDVPHQQQHALSLLLMFQMQQLAVAAQTADSIWFREVTGVEAADVLGCYSSDIPVMPLLPLLALLALVLRSPVRALLPAEGGVQTRGRKRAAQGQMQMQPVLFVPPGDGCGDMQHGQGVSGCSASQFCEGCSVQPSYGGADKPTCSEDTAGGSVGDAQLGYEGADVDIKGDVEGVVRMKEEPGGEGVAGDEAAWGIGHEALMMEGQQEPKLSITLSPYAGTQIGSRPPMQMLQLVVSEHKSMWRIRVVSFAPCTTQLRKVRGYGRRLQPVMRSSPHSCGACSSQPRGLYGCIGAFCGFGLCGCCAPTLSECMPVQQFLESVNATGYMCPMCWRRGRHIKKLVYHKRESCALVADAALEKAFATPEPRCTRAKRKRLCYGG